MSVCHFRVTRPRNHLSVVSPHQGRGRKMPLTSSHLMTRIISLHSTLLLWVLQSGSVTQQNSNCHHNRTHNELLSGNEPPFNSAEFANFLWSSGTEHVTSSPGYPQSNGWVENAVKTAKSLIKKAKALGADYFLSLLRWRNTPMEGLSTSPAQPMFRRCDVCESTSRSSRHLSKTRQSE